MWDFLVFNTFITKYVLIFFYYLFAFLLPIMIYVFRKYFIVYIEKYYIDKKYIWIIMTFFLFCIEIFLRMFFEMLIGYFDMHDYLHQIVEKVN